MLTDKVLFPLLVVIIGGLLVKEISLFLDKRRDDRDRKQVEENKRKLMAMAKEMFNTLDSYDDNKFKFILDTMYELNSRIDGAIFLALFWVAGVATALSGHTIAGPVFFYIATGASFYHYHKIRKLRKKLKTLSQFESTEYGKSPTMQTARAIRDSQKDEKIPKDNDNGAV